MRPVSARIVLALALAAVGVLPLRALADDAGSPPTPPSASILLFRADRLPVVYPRAFPATAPGTDGPFPWSAWRWAYANGDHSLEFTGGLTSVAGPRFLGDGLPTEVLTSSLTYRYRLFGGVLRPVARITVGGARWYDPVGGGSLRGFESNGDFFAAAEAGMEIVVRGYGVGVTAAYVLPAGMDRALAMHDKHKGSRTFDPDRTDFLKHWRFNVYPIIDQP